jgi:hypothetical protein
MLEADVAVRAGAILYHNLLPERLTESGRDDASQYVVRATRRVGDDQANGARRIVLAQRRGG